MEKLHHIICDEKFDIDKNFVLIKKRKSSEKEKYSTPYTLMDLEYDSYDVIDSLKQLTVGDYSETLFDTNDDKPPLLFVFGKNINEKQVYIKVKIKGNENQWILCLSFHYAERPMSFPYA